MKKAIGETERRRKVQAEYNKKHKITPTSVKKHISDALHSIYEKDYFTVEAEAEKGKPEVRLEDIPKRIEELRKEMRKVAERMEFERAAEIRDEIKRLRDREMAVGIRT